MLRMAILPLIKGMYCFRRVMRRPPFVGRVIAGLERVILGILGVGIARFGLRKLIDDFIEVIRGIVFEKELNLLIRCRLPK